VILTPLDAAPFEPTTKRAGDRVLSLHRVQVINDHGGVEPEPISHPNAGPAMPLHQWPSLPLWALMGLAMGLLVVWGICS